MLLRTLVVAGWVLIAVPRACGDVDDAVAILDALEQVTPAARYENARLAAVIADLADRAPVACWADWASLERLAVEPDDVIALAIPAGPLATLFGAVALHLGDEFERPVFEVHEGQIVLTTLDASAVMGLTDVYDLRDLTADAAVIEGIAASPAAGEDDAPHVEDLDSEEVDANAPDAVVAPGWQPLDTLLESAAPERDRSPAERLWMVIAQHVDPDAWRDLGGSRGVVHDYEGLLIVTAPATTHRRFRAALARLRRARPSALEVDVAIVDVPRPRFDDLRRRDATNSSRLGRMLLASDDVTVRWRTGGLVAIGDRWEAESKAGPSSVEVALAPVLAENTGLLHLAVLARTRDEAEERHVDTNVTIPMRDGGAVLELPGVGAQETLRLLVIVPRRR